MSKSDFPTVVVVGAFPPPMHGQAAINAAVVEELRKLPVSLAVVDTSPGTAKKNVKYHLKRILGVLRAAKELTNRSFERRKTLYMPYQAGNGIVYNLFLALVARATGFPIVLHHHSSAHTLRRHPIFALLVRLCGERTVHVALTARMARHLKEHYGLAGRIIISSNACHIPSTARSQVERTNSGLVVGLLANLCAEKGLQLAIDTIVEARQKGANVKLVLAGPLVGAAAEESVARASSILGESLEVWGPLDSSGKERFFRYVSVFLFPTTYRYEAQPLVIYEAMSHGIPVISTDAGYIPEMLAQIGTIIPTDSGIQHGLTTELLKFWNDDDWLARASAGSKREFEKAAAISRAEFSELCETLMSK